MCSLRKQLKEQTEQPTVTREVITNYTPFGVLTEEREELTLAGKIDAILEHFGLEVSVQQEKVVPSKVVVKKVKKAKKGRR